MSKEWLSLYPNDCEKVISLGEIKNLAQAFAETSKKYSAHKAFTCMDSTLTYSQFEQASTNLASYLQNDLKLKKGDRIAIMLPNILQFPIAFYAAQKLGLICVHTNPMYTQREMLHQFNDSETKAIIILDLFADKLEKIIKKTKIKHTIIASISEQLPFLKGKLVSAYMKFSKKIPGNSLNSHKFNACIKEGAKKDFYPQDIDLDDIALFQYTGGTTGVPKAAELTQKNLLSNSEQIANACGSQILNGMETVLTALPLYHIFSLTANFLSFTRRGNHLILIPDPQKTDAMMEVFKKYKPSIVTGINTLFNSINNNKKFNELAPKNIKVTISGGMALQTSVANKWKQITGNTMIEGFGLTEASPVTHVTPLGIVGAPKNSIGLPVASIDAKIVDDKGNEVSNGETGELIIQGPQVMKGYWKNPENTKETIKNNWLYTGDIAKRDDEGWFYIVDRKKDLIIVSGFNVYPNELEEVISHHPKVLECAVIGVKNSRTGESVKLFVVKKDCSLTKEEVKDFCKEQLTGYKRPKEIVFVDSLPKSNIGKILRKDLH